MKFECSNICQKGNIVNKGDEISFSLSRLQESFLWIQLYLLGTLPHAVINKVMPMIWARKTYILSQSNLTSFSTLLFVEGILIVLIFYSDLNQFFKEQHLINLFIQHKFGKWHHHRNNQLFSRGLKHKEKNKIKIILK